MSIYNLIMAIFCILFSAYCFYDQKKFNDSVKSQNTTVKEIKRDKSEVYFYGGIIAISLITAIACFIFKIDVYIFFLIIALFCITLLSNENQSSRLYYTKNGFYLADGFISYKKISKIQIKSKRSATLILKDGKDYKISGRKAAHIEETRK